MNLTLAFAAEGTNTGDGDGDDDRSASLFTLLSPTCLQGASESRKFQIKFEIFFPECIIFESRGQYKLDNC